MLRRTFTGLLLATALITPALAVQLAPLSRE